MKKKRQSNTKTRDERKSPCTSISMYKTNPETSLVSKLILPSIRRDRGPKRFPFPLVFLNKTCKTVRFPDGRRRVLFNFFRILQCFSVFLFCVPCRRRVFISCVLSFFCIAQKGPSRLFRGFSVFFCFMY